MIAASRTTARAVILLGGIVLIGCGAARSTHTNALPGTERATPPPYRHIPQGTWTDAGPGNGESGIVSVEDAPDETVTVLEPMVITPATANEPAPASESAEEDESPGDPPAPDVPQDQEEDIRTE